MEEIDEQCQVFGAELRGLVYALTQQANATQRIELDVLAAPLL